ncbi:MAG: guanylate kinase [Verrucomicrobia bacterium]|nr:MAG: guanylate kinase [Verrucomicrobiota bacterium]
MSNSTFRHTGILFVVSAPSGAGKTTLCRNLRQQADFIYAVSCTTRTPRPGEIVGEDYYFLSEEEFQARIEDDEFLEYAEVHGRKYGTLKATVFEHLKKGVDVLLDIDTQGAAAIRSCRDPFILDALVDVFIMPPNIEELRHRLLRRGSDSEEQIAVRLKNAQREMLRWKEYKYTILSGSMEEDIAKFRSVMRAEHYLSRRLSLDLA